MNYRGYFKSLDCTEYTISFIKDSGDTYTDLMLDGDNPISITYAETNLLFQPKQISTATITVVNDEYLIDLFTPYAQGVKVEVFNDTDNSIVWRGYLKPQIYSQGYEKCYEKIEFEASDCLASLQYFDYHLVSGKKQIVTFKDIIDQACDIAGVDGYLWPRTKRMNGTVLLPEHLSISEQNFFSSDTDEPWKYDEVLEEMCKYLGLTLLQWENYFYFVDATVFHTAEEMDMNIYLKGDDYQTGLTGSCGPALDITVDTYRGDGHSISFEPIYNKASVKANFYYAENFIPDIDNEEMRTNRFGGTRSVEVPAHPNGIKLEWWERESSKKDTGFTPVYIYDGYRKYDEPDDRYCYFHRFIDHEWYSPIYYTSGLTPTTPASADLTTSRITRSFISGQLVEFGSAEVGNNKSYAYELASAISFKNYLLIHQWDQPFDVETFNRLWDVVNEFPPVFKLNSGYTNPIIVDSGNSYLCLFANAIFERYDDREYINPSWSNNASTDAGRLFQHGRWWIQAPWLNFKVGIGDKWWNGSAWTATETNFWVKCRSEVEKDDETWVEGDNWNVEREILNNIPLTDWTGADGYKIPLDNTLDMNADIHFYVNLPTRLGYIHMDNETLNITDGQNHWCWLSDLSLTVHNKNTGAKDEKDIVYGAEDGGVIDDKSVMELEEMSLKITTFPGDTKISYSNVGDAVNGGYLTKVTEPNTSISWVARKPEENLLARYIQQYSTQTIKENITVDLSFTPFNKIYDDYWDGKKFIWNGAEIDLRRGRQTITIVETK